MKNAGKNIFYQDSQFTNPIVPAAKGKSEIIKNYLVHIGFNIQHVELIMKEDRIAVYGQMPSQDLKEKVILAIGNLKGVAEVEDHLTVSNPTSPSRFYTVRPGDTLSKISLEYYDNANKNNFLFEANKYLIKTPEALYPGLVLRIPRENIS